VIQLCLTACIAIERNRRSLSWRTRGALWKPSLTCATRPRVGREARPISSAWTRTGDRCRCSNWPWMSIAPPRRCLRLPPVRSHGKGQLVPAR